MTKLEGKVAIVTGSGRGIGQAIALKLTPERVYRALHGKGEKLVLDKPAMAA